MAKPERPVFRFMGLEVWKDASEISHLLFDLADRLEASRLYRFAEQTRGVGISMTNNIAEGSGSVSSREFHQFLNIARRSTFEGANLILAFEKRKLVSEEEATEILIRLDRVSRKVTNFQKSLRTEVVPTEPPPRPNRSGKPRPLPNDL